MAAETPTAEGGLTPGEYIVHHLTHWRNHQLVGGNPVDFSAIAWDSVGISILLGVLTCLTLWLAARKATAGVPGRFQGAVEWLAEMVETQAKGIVHNANSRKLVSPLALTVFIWIVLLNTMDLIPVDLLPVTWQAIVEAFGGNPHHAYLRVVPTADLSITMGLSISVLIVCLVYNVRIKGIGGWAHELVTAPFGTSKNPLFAVLLGVVNFAMQIVEFTAKTVSHGMRLFGNMYAGELLFMLIALLGGAWTLSATGIGLAIVQVILGVAWAIFHILIILLQAFVFMMLALVYIGQAHDAH
jgi:F-type H+-transporting ATPase subunit a